MTIFPTRRAEKARGTERRIRRLADAARFDGRLKDAAFLNRCADTARRGWSV